MRGFLLVSVVALTPFAARAADKPHVKPQDKPQDVPLANLGDKFRLIGKLGEPLGTVVTVQGVVVEGPFKGFEGGPNLRIQRIDGRATQEDIQICIRPYFGKYGEQRASKEEVPKLDFGKTYEFEGYETGQFVGVPGEAYKRAGLAIATTGFYFRHELAVYKGKRTTPVVWSPADFVDREALIEGQAVSRQKRAYIEGNGWKMLADSAAGWPKEFEGKTVEGFGMVKKGDAAEFRLEKGVTRLVRLEDQRGRAVELRGRSWSLNGYWWLEYRGTKLYVEDMENLPGWKESGPHGGAVLITGILDEAELPDLDQISLKSERDKKKYFIVRKAAWKRLDALLAPERAER